MRTIEMVFRRAFAADPFAEFDIWLKWKYANDQEFEDYYEDLGGSLVEGSPTIVDIYADDADTGRIPDWGWVRRLAAPFWSLRCWMRSQRIKQAMREIRRAS
ncbi:MAG TPA: hypothetical protein V6D06_04200 [Trichocoleus sp.]